jgi:hypothetical protein
MFQYLLQSKHIEKLKEMVWAMEMWAMGEGIDVEALKFNEWTPRWPPGPEIEFDFSKIMFQGCGGVPGMFAAMVMYNRGLRAGDHNFTHATMAWKGVILTSTERSVESMAVTSIAWQTRILALVDRWIMKNKQEDRLI